MGCLYEGYAVRQRWCLSLRLDDAWLVKEEGTITRKPGWGQLGWAGLWLRGGKEGQLGNFKQDRAGPGQGRGGVQA